MTPDQTPITIETVYAVTADIRDAVDKIDRRLTDEVGGVKRDMNAQSRDIARITALVEVQRESMTALTRSLGAFVTRDELAGSYVSRTEHEQNARQNRSLLVPAMTAVIVGVPGWLISVIALISAKGGK
jgi:hypothetical protein